MKTKIGLIVISLMTILMLGAISATSTTIIAGKIYNSDYTATIPQADVEVTCGGNLLTTQSDNDGAYKVKYEGLCVVDDTLTVYAEKDALSGSKTGTVKASGTCGANDNCLINVFTGVDVAVVNVPLVPEFGTFVGVLTALGALGVFFIVRRK